MPQSVPLLKFPDEAAELASEGLELIRTLPGVITPVIFIGDGRGGKSYLASRVLCLEEAFVSSDSAEPVTEGIDIAVQSVDRLLAECGSDAEGVAPAGDGEHLLVMDCEGGNNAMAAIRTLVNVFGLAVCTEVVFVVSGMASEASLQNLSASLAAKSLIRVDENSKMPEQHLIFVVNKNMLRYDDTALEKLLDADFPDEGRREMREVIKEAFPSRSFFPVPMMGLPEFEPRVALLRKSVLQKRKHLTMGGQLVKSEQLCGLLKLITEGVKATNEVSFPSMHRFVVMDGFLTPTATQILADAQEQFPMVVDWDAELELKNPTQAALALFDDKTNYISQRFLVDEARNSLLEKLTAAWEAVHRTNEAFGEQIKSMSQESRELIMDESQGPVGKRGLLSKVYVTRQTMKVESRSCVLKKRGGPPTYTEWEDMGSVVRLKESAFDKINSLPVLRGRLLKASPNPFRTMMSIVMNNEQDRACVLKDGHFLWWEPKDMTSTEGSAASGCINFFVHRAAVAAASGTQSFCIKPADRRGWGDTSCFTGGEHREFVFDCQKSEITCSEWVASIRKHIEFANAAFSQLGEERVLNEVGVGKRTMEEVDG